MSVTEKKQRRPEDDIVEVPSGQSADTGNTATNPAEPRSAEEDVQQPPKQETPAVQQPQQEVPAVQQQPQQVQDVPPAPSVAASTVQETPPPATSTAPTAPSATPAAPKQPAEKPQDEGVQRRQRFESSISALNLGGTVDHLAERSPHTADEMIKAGYSNVPEGSHRLYPITYTVSKSDGTPFTVTVSPIYPDGTKIKLSDGSEVERTVLDKATLDTYMDLLVENFNGDWEKMKEFDGGEGGLHVLIGHDLSDESMSSLDSAYNDYYNPSSPVSLEPSQGAPSPSADQEEDDYSHYKKLYEKYSDDDLKKIWSSNTRGELITQIAGDILAERGLIVQGDKPSATAAPMPKPNPDEEQDDEEQPDEEQVTGGQVSDEGQDDDEEQAGGEPKPEREVRPSTTDWKSEYKDSSAEELDTIISTAQSVIDDPKADESEKEVMHEKVRQLTELRDEKRRASGSEPTAASVSENTPRYSKRQQQRRDEAAEAMSDKSVYNGNVDLLNRPRVDAKTMQAAGYNVPDGSYSTLYSMRDKFPLKDPATGETSKVDVVYTPILPNGTVMSEDEAWDYIYNLALEKGEVIESDKPENGGKGIVIATGVTDDNFEERLHDLQDAYYSTPEDYSKKSEDASAFLSGMNGNQNPVAYKPVSKKAMVDAGWTAVGQSEDEEFYAWPVEQEIVDKDGKTHKVVMTPITPEGDILSPEDFEGYVDSLQGSSNPLDEDKGDSKLILMYDCEPGAADDVYNNIGTWVMGQADPEEGQRPSYRGEYIDDTRDTLVQNVATLQQQIDALNENIRNFLEHPESTTRGAMLLNEYNSGLKAEGLTAEDEKRREKRNRTARIIANLGDVLQGFANLAGTWYGAKSQNLTSVTGGVDARHKTEGDARSKRAEALRKSYKEGIDRIYKELNTDLTSLRKMWMAAVNRLADFDKASGVEAQRSSNIDKRQERNAKRKERENRRREDFQREQEATRQKNRIDLEKLKQKNREASQAAKVAGQIRVKQTPGAKAR